MNPIQIFDQILGELVLGRAESGIALLAGTLDMAALHTDSFGEVVETLHRHPLTELLNEDPLYCGSPHRPGGDGALLDLITGGEPSRGVGRTGLRLLAADRQLPLCRALRERRLELWRRLERAWQSGQRIGLLDGEALGGAAVLRGRDLSNLTMIDCDPADPAGWSRPEQGGFDLILIGEQADRWGPPALARALGRLAPELCSGGVLALCTLLPEHFGTGWRQAYLEWEPHCHSAASVRAAVASAGYAAVQFQDETGCMIWNEISRGGAVNLNLGGNTHA